MGTTTVTVGQDTTLIGSKGICLVTLKGGYKAPGRAQREFCPSRFGRKRGDLLAAAARQLAAFSSKFFPDWSIGISLEIDLGALSMGGRIQCWCERTQLNSGTISDGKKRFP